MELLYYLNESSIIPVNNNLAYPRHYSMDPMGDAFGDQCDGKGGSTMSFELKQTVKDLERQLTNLGDYL
jgi:hypothetical protein